MDLELNQIFTKYRLCQSPDPIAYTSYVASCALTDLSNSVNYLLDRYPAKTSGALSLSGSAALIYEGIQTQNLLMIGCGTLYLTSDRIMMLYADPVKNPMIKEPQDANFRMRDLLNYKHYPVEASTALEAWAGYTMLAMGVSQAGENGQAEFIISGSFDTVANGIALLVRERETAPLHYEYRVLNIPVIKDISDFIVTRPNSASSLLSLTGLAGLGLYELGHNDWNAAEANLLVLGFSATNILAETAFMFSQKRAKIPEIQSPSSMENEFDVFL